MSNSDLPNADSVRTLLDAGAATNPLLSTPGTKPVVIVPFNYTVKELPLLPERIPRHVKLADAESFAAYVNRYKTDDEEGILLTASVNDSACSVCAYLDYWEKPFLPGTATAAERGWFSHCAALDCRPTKEWLTWMAHNGSQAKKDQTAFALFLEDNERLFRAPSGAELLELVTTLEGKSNVRFNSSVRLSNGKAKLDYEEDVELRGSMGSVNGALEIPTELICAISPFEGQSPYEVRSRLRYRIEARKLTFWYDTIAPHLIVRDAAKSVLEAVEKLVKLPLLRV